MSEQQLAFPYKIHGLRVAQGKTRAMNSGTFYCTMDEAEEAAVQCIAHPVANSQPDAIVIYKAVKVIRPKAVPTESAVVGPNGEFEF